MRRMRGLLLALLLARLVLGLAYSALNPLGEAPDEADHYAYAAYIGAEHRLPDDFKMTQAKHPPLYHILAAAAASPFAAMDFTFLRSNPAVTVAAAGPDRGPNFFVHTRLEAFPWRDGALAMHLGRLVSVMAGLLLVAATYGLGRRVWPVRPALALAGAAFVAFLPESLFVAGAMSNDTLAALLSTLGLWAALAVSAGCAPGRLPDRRAATGDAAVQTRQPGERRALVLALLSGLCLGLAFVTKVSTVALWPVAALAIWLDRSAREPARAGSAAPRRLLSLRPSALALPAAALTLALVVALPWLWRNVRLYGDPLGTPMMLATIDRRVGPLTAVDLLWLVRGWFFSFWGKFGGAGQLSLPWPFYALWAALLLLAAGGWFRLARRAARERAGLLAETRPAAQAVLWASPAMTALSILSYSRIALGTDQGRLLFPALAPLALLMAGGLAAWLPERRQAWLPGGVAALMGAVAVLALVAGIVVPFAPPAPPSAAEIAAARPVGRQFGDGLELMALAWAPAAPGESGAGLTLYWRAARPLNADLRTVLRVPAAGGDAAWEAKRSPAAGRFSTDRWPTGRLVADVYRLPAEALRSGRLQLGVQSFPTAAWWPPTPGDGAAYLDLPLPGPAS